MSLNIKKSSSIRRRGINHNKNHIIINAPVWIPPSNNQDYNFTITINSMYLPIFI